MSAAKIGKEAITVLFLFFAFIAGCVSSGPDGVSPDVFEKMSGGDTYIIDVRTPEEYLQGHIEGADNMDYYSPDFREKISKLDIDKAYLLYCRTGHGSGESLKIMNEMGFRNVTHLSGGINEWISQGKKIV
ncbi:MAG: rhodanese-like domain-containing protein [Candidatus Altiarchaeota archaeon]|nr:rhodanese-like domain-containing protein [Candidatus Altiarchaeota archaeon]